jgi:hypothetical protein
LGYKERKPGTLLLKSGIINVEIYKIVKDIVNTIVYDGIGVHFFIRDKDRLF